VTVLFVDVKSSMQLSEQLEAEDWHTILDRFFEILTEGVHRFEGTVNQYTGDGIMALFGAPIAHEDHAQRACYAALHLRDALKQYADRLRVERGLNFSARMGINSGEVVVGKIGDDLRMDYTAKGHTVGLAQRMEALAEAGKALLAGPTIEQVEGYFELRDLGETQVRGVEAPVHLAELQGVGRMRTRLDRSRARGLSRFVGRDEEMARLESALDRALTGDGQVVGVVAEAGAGKSRLCHELAERCRARGIPLRSGEGVPHGAAVPLEPALRFYREIMGITRDDGPSEARQKIAGLIAQLAPRETFAHAAGEPAPRSGTPRGGAGTPGPRHRDHPSSRPPAPRSARTRDSRTGPSRRGRPRRRRRGATRRRGGGAHLFRARTRGWPRPGGRGAGRPRRDRGRRRRPARRPRGGRPPAPRKRRPGDGRPRRGTPGGGLPGPPRRCVGDMMGAHRPRQEVPMDWRSRLGGRLVSAEEAVSHVASGATVGVAPFTTTPVTLCEGLVARGRASGLSDVRIEHPASLFCWTEPDLRGVFRLRDNYATVHNREACHAGEVDYLPIGLWRSHAVPDGLTPDPDVFLVPVSPPDARGYCSYGTGVWFSPTVVQGAKLVLAEVQADFIRTGGENHVHVDQIDWFVEGEAPIAAPPTPSPSDEEVSQVEAICTTVAVELVEDGDTLQMGVGTVSASLGRFLDFRNDLGIQTELVTSGIAELVQRGNVTGERKAIHRGKVVGSALVSMPREELELIDGNPVFELYDFGYTDDLRRLIQLDHFVTVNNAMVVDLTGQVSAEAFDHRPYTGVGGQTVFMLAGAYSPGGKSISVVPSSSVPSNGGTRVTRIVPTLAPGTPVTVPRTYVDFVVTEFGAAELRGKTVQQRARALCEIAHPDFRDELADHAKRLYGA
jgi:acyl-CoA hydrolase/class 3 adenylate cyclase